MGDDPQEELTARILEEFRRRYCERAPFRQDRELADELVIEARPGVDALLAAVDSDQDDRMAALDHHEGLALLRLLGRRGAALGLTPTAALGVPLAVAAGFAHVGRPVPAELLDHVSVVFFEGYVSGREERLVEDASRAAGDALPVLKLAPGCLLMILAGVHDSEPMADAIERLGRQLFKTDARAALVDITHLEDPTPERAAEVFGAHATARMLGAVIVFSGVSDAWLEAAREAGVTVDILTTEAGFEAGIRRTLDIVGLEVRPAGRLRRSLKHWLTRKGGDR